jgi:hypothetical protein
MPQPYQIIVARTICETSIYAVHAHDEQEAKLKFGRMDDYARNHCLVEHRTEEENGYELKAV